MCVVGSGGGVALVCTVPLEWCTMHGQIFYDFSFGHGTTQCVRLIVTLRLYRYTSSVCTL